MLLFFLLFFGNVMLVLFGFLFEEVPTNYTHPCVGILKSLNSLSVNKQLLKEEHHCVIYRVRGRSSGGQMELFSRKISFIFFLYTFEL